jgi:hypothetical protein
MEPDKKDKYGDLPPKEGFSKISNRGTKTDLSW